MPRKGFALCRLGVMLGIAVAKQFPISRGITVRGQKPEIRDRQIRTGLTGLELGEWTAFVQILLILSIETLRVS
jgi:hypothetical protein